MIIFGYPGELIVEGNLGTRWFYWAAAMVPFLYIVYELLVGLADATQLESEPRMKDLNPRAEFVDSAELVDLPSRVCLPHARVLWCQRHCGHSGGILRL